ncbi:hypothetical protein DdX_20166 [Ditylenchus destructor]|uniref:Uncharacterized protein n=1 Tax=Ditylenchus destructor TaxID=166010 RepID=A0AAD4MLV6_9BILA|nr:hypothetical protein DdX_20166 [Ditylenchus destructor]
MKLKRTINKAKGLRKEIIDKSEKNYLNKKLHPLTWTQIQSNITDVLAQIEGTSQMEKVVEVNGTPKALKRGHPPKTLYRPEDVSPSMTSPMHNNPTFNYCG